MISIVFNSILFCSSKPTSKQFVIKIIFREKELNKGVLSLYRSVTFKQKQREINPVIFHVTDYIYIYTPNSYWMTFN